MDEYNKAVAKGKQLLSAMNARPDDPAYPQSPFTSFDDLAATGWTASASQPVTIESPSCPGAYQLMHSEGLPLDASNNIEVSSEHLTETWVGDIIYEPTHAIFRQIFNPKGHTILANSLFSPCGMNTSVRLPPLSHWSDVTYLQWAHLAGDNKDLRQSLQRVVHCDIKNKTVRGVIDKVVMQGGSPVQNLPYPGRTFVASDGERFEALLGTSNLSGIGYMLAQHKSQDQLGWKVVESISVWCPTADSFSLTPEYYVAVNIASKA